MKMKTYREIIQNNLKLSAENGVYPKFLSKHFFNEIQKAADDGHTTENLVFANAVYGENSGFIFPESAAQYKTHDFYMVKMDGMVSRWFPGVDLSEFGYQ
jgi:hypothetical protein